MGLFQPLNILYGLSLAVLVAIYLLSARQPKLIVSSLMLFDYMPAPITKRRFRSDIFFWLEAAGLGALSLAAAGLFLKLAPAHAQSKHLALVFDLGAAMGAREGSTQRLEMAKQRARALVFGARAEDEFSVVSYAIEARVILGASADKRAVVRAIDGLRVDDTASRSAAFAAALSVAREADQVEVFAARLPPSAALIVHNVGAPVRFNRVGSTQDNLAIAALEPGRPLTDPGYCTVRSFAERTLSCELAIDLNGQPIERRRLSLKAHSQIVVPFGPLPAGGLLRAAILGDDALGADNVRYAYAASFSGRRVLIISADSSVSEELARIVNSVGPGATIETLAPTQPNSAGVGSMKADERAIYDLVITYDALPQAQSAAATLAIFPRSGAAFRVDGTTTRSVLERITDRGTLLSPVALERSRVLSVADWMKVTASGTSLQPLRMIPLAAIGRTEHGRVGVIAFDVRGHLLYDPDRLDVLTLTIDMLKDLLAPTDIRVVSTGTLVSTPARAPAKLIAPDGSVMTLNPDREQRVSFRPLLIGHYRIEAGTTTENVFANYFDASESDLTVEKKSTHNWPRPPATKPASTMERVRPASGFLLGLALIAFLIETALLAVRPRQPGEANSANLSLANLMSSQRLFAWIPSSLAAIKRKGGA
jgi:hypothetical protein